MTYYAQRSPYGTATASPADALHGFGTRAQRAQWIAADPEHRAAITRDTARRWYPAAFDASRVWHIWQGTDTGAQEWTGAPTGGVYKEL